LQGKDGARRNNTNGESISILGVIESPRSVTEQRQRTETHRPDPEREGEHGPDAGTDG